jgi:hypothetical protein
VSIGPTGISANGTLGGILDLDGDIYALTCGHVIDEMVEAVQPSEPDGGAGMIVGRCEHSTSGQLLGSGFRCRAHGVANAVDAALIDLSTVSAPNSVLGLGHVTAVAGIADVAEDETVKASSRSGLRRLQVGALALRRSITIGADLFCFKELFELRRTGNNWGMKGSLKPPTRSGDSGAWVVREDSGGLTWLGMVTAGDGPSSYAQFAETVEAWAIGEVRARAGTFVP